MRNSTRLSVPSPVMASRLLAVALLGIGSISSAFAQNSFLWGTSSSTGVEQGGGLYMLDPNSGAADLVGFSGIANARGSISISGIDFHPRTGMLYGVIGGSGFNNPGSDLITINPETGIGTLVGTMSGSGFDPSDQTPPSGCGSLAFAPDGRLFAGCWEGEAGPSQGKILEIDPETGAVLALRPTTNGELLTGLAYSPEGVLWGSRGGNIGDGPAVLHTVNPDTGMILSTLPLSDADARVSSLAFAPDGTLYASLPQESTLATISTASGAVTKVGSYGDTVARIAGLASTSNIFKDCSVSFDPRGASFGPDGGSGETIFTLMENPATAPSSCPGSMDLIASDVPWITVTDIRIVGSLIGMTGRMVKGPIDFQVDPLGLSGTRQGTISARVGLTAGGSIRTSFVVTQSAAEGESPEITGVLDAASGVASISPGSIVSVFGFFADQTALANSIPLSFDLDGFSVTFDGMPGALFGVFAGDAFDQANVQVPWGVDVGDGKVEVKVHWKDEAGEAWSEPFEADGALASPGIYMFPPGATQAIVTNFKLPGDDVIAGSWAQAPGSVDSVVGQAAAIGGVIIIWANGLGPVVPEPLTGDLPPGAVPVPTKTVRVTIGGKQAQVLGAVLQPTNVGLSQINAIVPAGVTPGDKVPIIIEVDCGDGKILSSRADVTIAVRAAP